MKEFKMGLDEILNLKIPQFITMIQAYVEIIEDEKRIRERERKKQEFFDKFK
jgi:hypothetical protein